MELSVIKIGGALISDPSALETLWDAVAQLTGSRRIIVVHGGGPRATEVARRLGHEPRVVHGRRVTTDLDLEIVMWTMRGELNSRLVARAHAHDVRAAGVSGVDGGMLRVAKRPPWNIEGEPVDFGWVGDVEKVDAALLHTLLEDGYVPVVAPLGADPSGHIFNVNADTVSCSIAGALGASEYLLVTEAGGVRRRADDPETLLQDCNRARFEEGKAAGWIADGMLVKLKVAFDALDAGVDMVYVVPPAGILNRDLGTRIVA